MSRLLAHHDVDFYWNMRKDQSEWNHRLSVNKIMNRFCRSLYTSKEGLALLLQQMYWHTEPGVASVNFPRCYVLGILIKFLLSQICIKQTINKTRLILTYRISRSLQQFR